LHNNIINYLIPAYKKEIEKRGLNNYSIEVSLKK